MTIIAVQAQTHGKTKTIRISFETDIKTDIIFVHCNNFVVSICLQTAKAGQWSSDI